MNKIKRVFVLGVCVGVFGFCKTYGMQLDLTQALMNAVKARNSELMDSILATRVSVDTRDVFGNTALHYSLELEYDEIAESLVVNYQAGTEIYNFDGKTQKDLAKKSTNNKLRKLFGLKILKKYEIERLKKQAEEERIRREQTSKEEHTFHEISLDDDFAYSNPPGITRAKPSPARTETREKTSGEGCGCILL